MSDGYRCQRIFLIFLTFLFASIQAFPQDKELDKLLRLDIEDLTDITVISATKSLSKINEVPSAVKVITSETLKEYNFFTLEDALSILPGFQFRNILGFNSYIFQRGVPNQNNLTLLLVDGIQINELNSGGFYTGGQFNLDNVQQIEVVYGPASALYGTNAISGVINIITKNPFNNRGLSVSGLCGSFKTYNGNIAYGYFDDENDFGFRISGMVKSSHKADLSGSEGDFNWSSNMENFENDYSIDLKSQYNDFQFGLSFQNKQSSRTTNYKSTGTEYLDKNTLWNISFLNAYAKYDYNLSSNLNLFSTIDYRNSTILDNTVAYITNNFQVGYYRPNNLVGLENMLSYSPSPDLKFIGGILFEYESLADDFSITYSDSFLKKPPAPPKPKMDNNTLLSLYLQTQYKIIDSFNLFGGVRFDHSSFYDDVITPRFGLIFNEKKFTVKFLYSEAYRAPKPWDYTFGLGNSNLRPEEMRAFEVAASYIITENAKVDLSVYKNELHDLIIQAQNDDGYMSVNKGNVETIGLEINVDYIVKSFRSFFNYTYNSSIDDNKALIPEVAKHIANLGFSYNIFNNMDLSIRCSYLGGRKNPQIISMTGNDFIDGAVVVYSSLNYTGYDKFRVSLIVNNLFNQTYYHTSNRPPERYRQPQSTILFKVEYNL